MRIIAGILIILAVLFFILVFYGQLGENAGALIREAFK